MFCQIKLDIILPSVTDFCLQASACTEALPVRVVLSGFRLTRGGGADGAGGRGEEEERGAGAGEIRGAARGSQVSQTFWRSFPHCFSFFSFTGYLNMD